MADNLDPGAPAGANTPAKGKLSDKDRHYLEYGGGALVAILVFLYLRPKSSSATSSTTASATPTAPYGGLGGGGWSNGQNPGSIQTELAALQGEFSSLQSQLSASGTGTPTGTGNPPATTFPDAPTPPTGPAASTSLSGSAAADQFNAGQAPNAAVSVQPGQTLAYSPTAGYTGTATSPSGLEQVVFGSSMTPADYASATPTTGETPQQLADMAALSNNPMGSPAYTLAQSALDHSLGIP